MQDFELKALISHLTGVNLVKHAMPLLFKQVNLKNRKLIWHIFDPKTLPVHLPNQMKGEVSKFYNDFASSYREYVSDANVANFDSMMFAWYAEDASISEDDLKRIEQSNLPNKDQLLRVAKFITEKGVPLAVSRHEWEQEAGGHQKETFNGGKQHLQRFGWAWGAKELPMEDDGRRETKPIPEKQLNNPSWLNENVFGKGAILVYPTTAQAEDGAWGIFFTEDGTEKIPVIPESMMREMKEALAGQDKTLTPDMPVMKHLLNAYGGFEKFFMNKSSHDPKIQCPFEPGKKRFLLDMRTNPGERPYDPMKDIKDPKPKGIHWSNTVKGATGPHPANDGRVKSMFDKPKPGMPAYAVKYKKNRIIDPRVWALMIRANGTLYWQNEADSSMQENLTEEQVNYFNEYQGRVFALGRPGLRRYGFNPDQQQNFNQYYEDCNYLNQLRDFIVETTGRDHVASQKWQVVLVAPRFTFGKQVGETETAGFLYHHKTESENAPMEQHPGLFTGKRDEWVVEKTEYDISQARAAQFSKTKDLPQNISGLSAISNPIESESCQAAVERAIQAYQIPPSVQPPPAKIQAAQQAFENARQHYKAMAGNAQQPINNGDATPEGQSTAPPTDPLAGAAPNAQQPTVQSPAPVQNIAPVQPQHPNEAELAKSSKEILDKLKKLG